MSPYKDIERRRQNSRDWYYNNKERAKANDAAHHERTKEQGKKNKAWHRQYFFDYLGGKCECCGTTENLEFDHIDPNNKKFCISAYIPDTPPGYPYTELVLEEVDKCQLLCKSCHKKKTYTLDKESILEKRAQTKAKKQ